MKTSPGCLREKSRISGFTLVELMIALVLGLVVVAAAVAVFLSNKKAYTTNDALSEIQDNSRVAFELMARDIREAGLTACGQADRVANVLNNGPNNPSYTGTVPYYADFSKPLMGYDDTQDDPAVAFGTGSGSRVTKTDSISILSAGDAGLSVSTYNPTSAEITLNEKSSTLQQGDIILICDPTHSAITQITKYTSTNVTLVHNDGNTVTPGNCSKDLDFPTVCSATSKAQQPFGQNSQIATLQAADWYIGHNTQGGTSLYRTALQNVSGVPTGVAQEMVRNVTDMQLLYHLSGGASYVSASTLATADWDKVDGVQMTLTFQSTNRFAGTDAKPLSRTLTAAVAVRNRVQ